MDEASGESALRVRVSVNASGRTEGSEQEKKISCEQICRVSA